MGGMTDVFGKGLYLKTVGNLARLLLVVNRQDIKNDEFILSTFPCTISSLANDHTLVNIRLGLRAGVDARCGYRYATDAPRSSHSIITT